MTFNVPLKECMEILEITSNTANLWRKKIFQIVNDYQNHLLLKDRVWLDETCIEDYKILGSDYKEKRLRGLSRTKICIVVAIDSYKNMIAIICGHGKPSSTRIYKTVKNHIEPNSTIIHDGEKAHNKLIQELHLKSEVYKADCKDDNYLNHMALINNMCGWIKRYIWRFIGMDVDNLQSYLNWYVYLLRCQRDNNKWKKTNEFYAICYSKGLDIPVNKGVVNHTIVDSPILFYIYFLISTTDTFITKATDFLSIVLERRSIIFLICFLQHPFFVSQKISHPRFSMCMSYTFYDYQLNSH